MAYQVRHYHKTKTSTEGRILESIFKAIWWLVTLPFKMLFGRKKTYQGQRGISFDKGFVNDKWQEIETLMRLGRPSNYSRAVIEADKLLDHILKGYRAPGLTMADRLKASKKRFSPEAYDAAWKGHKVRNELVHNAQYELMDYQAKETINYFRIAIQELI